MSSAGILKHIKQIVRVIYSKDETGDFCKKLKNLMDLYGRSPAISQRRRKYEDRVVLNEKDAVLITYPHTIYGEDEKPLNTLRRFLKTNVKDAISSVHILPFFPSSSDGGYAVIDHKEVDPRFGTWEDVQEIAGEYRLMVDLVMNHVSSKSKWFTRFLQGDRRYRDYFIWSDKKLEMPEVFRPRDLPLSTRFETAIGTKYVWTTFSADQIDLNYKNPEVLLRMLDIFLFYLSQGAEIIRLDAIGYIWKEPHTTCVNLSKTHQIVRLLRRILEYVAPYALLVTEANFPYRDNVSYFGEGHEANMVYNFSLPPLVLDAFARKDTTYLRKISNRTRDDLLFLDFLASQDGIGLLSAREILSKKDFDNILRLTELHGGLISYERENRTKAPYELNITYFDAINNRNNPIDPLAVKRFIASQAIMLSLKGVPGIYIHSLLGSRNYYKGVKETGVNRTINRETLREDALGKALSDVHTRQHQVLERFLQLLNIRREIPAFHPSGSKEVVASEKRLLVIVRRFHGEAVWVLINVSEDTVLVPEYSGKSDIITKTPFHGRADPYSVYFLR
jgi:sucrose phosphorylase